MGGRGSGRPASFGLLTETCEGQQCIDLAWLRRQTNLVTGCTGQLTWSRKGNETGSIGYCVETGGLRLLYRTRQRGGEWRDVDDLVPFEYTDTNFSGRRRWFSCPTCNRRCRILYGGAYFRCRKCHGLRYESQYEASYFRGASQSHKLRARLGQSGSLSDPFPPRPKGMHRSTYQRLRWRDLKFRERWLGGLKRWLRPE